jgi:hypothetical protein
VFNINPKFLIIGGAAIFSLLVLFIIFFIYLYQRIGLLSMNHRTALLGGQISWHSLNPGTEVQIIIPVENKYR